MKGSPPRGPGRQDQRGFNEVNTSSLARLTAIPDSLARIEQAITSCLGQVSAAIAQLNTDVGERLVWVHPYDPNRPGGYKRNEMVRDGGWTMTANKDTTDRPAPQLSGSPYWLSELPGMPAWVLQGATASSLIVGQRYTSERNGYVTAIRFDRAEATPTVDHSLWIVVDPLGTPDSQKLIGPVVPDDTGWFVLPQGKIFVLVGQSFDAFLASRAISVPAPFSGTWDYKRSNGDPSEKEVWHQSAGGGLEMRVHHVDDEDADRQADLEKLQPGDTIEAGSGDWTVTAVEHHLDHVRFEVDPASRISEGKYLFTFTTYAPQPIAYNRADNHYAGDARVQGFYSESGYNNMVLDQHAYGVDVQVQDATISPDWDLVAFTD